MVTTTHFKYIISRQSWFKLCLILAAAAGLIFFYNYVLLLLTALVIALVLRPLVAWLENKGSARWLAVLAVFMVLLFILVAFIVIFTPLFEQQIQEVARNLPDLANRLDQWLSQIHRSWSVVPNLNQLNNQVADFLAGQSWSVSQLLAPLFSSFLNLVIFFGAIFYLTLDKKLWSHLSWLDEHHAALIKSIGSRTESRLSHWALGQLFLCLTIFLMAYLVLSLLGVQYAFLLSLLAGVLEAIPYLGSITTGVIASLFALANQPDKLIWILLAFYLIQEFEHNVLVPKVMARVAGVNSLTVLLVVIVATKLVGVLGAFLAVPVLVMIRNAWLLIKESKLLTKSNVLVQNLA